ncbi:hypothetical protein VCB98_02040 [Gammaproteobacteria bacterium AB-CW1]|uniref:Uncharacterized protein n=1 Tax=Natronospira elongata TaxID=3110268 RepID=A0AAP6JCW1_9GAMM|nr:hypothetical protein [Gammaproteobacteria bacterium AB-CW1]
MSDSTDQVVRHALWLPLSAALAYAGFYLYAIGDIDVMDSSLWGLMVGELSLERILSARAVFQFEPVVMIEAGYLVILISPLNLAMTVLLAGLLAANLHGVLHLRANPSCRYSASGSLSGALPALLAGGACCAPSLILLLGLPGLGAFAAFFAWLVPVSLLALAASRIWQRRLGAPPMVSLLPHSS